MESSELAQLSDELMESLPPPAQEYIRALYLLVTTQRKVIEEQLPLQLKQIEEVQARLSKYEGIVSQAKAPAASYTRPTKHTSNASKKRR